MLGLKIGPSLIQGYYTCLTRLSGADGQYVSAEVPSINCVRPRSSVAYSAEGLFWQGFKRIVETGWQFWAASLCSPPLMLSEEQRRAAHVTQGRKWRQEKYRLHASLTNIGPGPLTFGCQGSCGWRQSEEVGKEHAGVLERSFLFNWDLPTTNSQSSKSISSVWGRKTIKKCLCPVSL